MQSMQINSWDKHGNLPGDRLWLSVSCAESIISVRREKLPAKQDFMNLQPLSISWSGATVNVKVSMPLWIPFTASAGRREVITSTSLSWAVSVENTQPAGNF